jgi:hypothetical protein
LAVFERLLARGTYQNFQKIFGNHDTRNCTTYGKSGV